MSVITSAICHSNQNQTHCQHSTAVPAVECVRAWGWYRRHRGAAVGCAEIRNVERPGLVDVHLGQHIENVTLGVCNHIEAALGVQGVEPVTLLAGRVRVVRALGVCVHVLIL